MKFTFEPSDLDILQAIVEESAEHLNGIEEGILRLEIDFEADLLDSIFRAMHSVKGVSSFADLVPINETAHSLESFLTDMKRGIYTVNSEVTDALLRGVDILHFMINSLNTQLLEIGQANDNFDIVIEDSGFREFIKELEDLRLVLSQNDKENINSESAVTPTQVPPSAEPDTKIKIELSSFLEQMLTEFFDETAEHLETIEQKCVDLERYPADPEILNSILRGFHSIKGGAGVISSMREQDNENDPVLAIKSLTHAVESLLQNFRNQSLRPSADLIDLILTSIDRVAILTTQVRENQASDFSIDNLLERIESMSAAIGETPQVDTQTTAAAYNNLPHQMAAFMNITSQAMDSMLGIIKSVQHNKPVDKKRTKQYIRALKNIASTARYLNYDEVVQMVEENLGRLHNVTPEKDTINSELLEMLEGDYNNIKHLLDLKISSIKSVMDNVPDSYGQKKLGEILVAEQRLTTDELNRALKKQKHIGEILVESGSVKQEDMELALAKQTIARGKSKEMTEPSRSSSEMSTQSIRVSQEKLDYLMNMIGELLISKNRVFHLANKISTDYSLPALSREVKGVAAELARISDELQNAIMSARMIPLRALFQRYPRTIRDTARKAGKTVELIIEGEETELDKTVIEAINDPLVHMLRNAVDHGIEDPETRQSLGKDSSGTIRLKAYYQGNHVVIEINDDGKGLNPDEIKLKALKKGLIKSDQIENMSNEDAYQIIFSPGFSTRDEVSELSGRGVGMDVVKTNVESVGGSVNLSSKINSGSQFTLKIPLSMSIIKGLIVESRAERFIIPLDSIEETVKLAASRIRSYKDSMLADIRGEILPLMSLNNILYSEKHHRQNLDSKTEELIHVVVISVDGIKCGIVVDRFQKEQEFVVKGLSEELASLRIYTGATILGDGSVVLILNLTQLLQMQQMMVGG